MLNNDTYHLVHKLCKYDKNAAENIEKWASRLQTQTLLHTFNSFDPKSVISFLFVHVFASDTIGVHEKVIIGPFFLFFKRLSAASSNVHLFLKPTLSPNTPIAKEEVLKPCPEVVNYRLQTLAANDFIAKTNANLTQYTEPPAMCPTQSTAATMSMLLKCGEAIDEYSVGKFYIVGLHMFVRHSM